MIKLNSLILCLTVLCSSSLRADVLFEGWYKILSANVHVGYIVQRLEYKPKTKTYSAKHLLKTNGVGGDITESLESTY